MKTSFTLSVLLAGALLLGATARAAPPNPVVDSTIQAIQQAADPSAAVSAYANAIALDRNEPKVYEAYVARMVDFGMPELAYRQAQTLTGLNSTNGLAWGVIAYVDARRGDMPEALAAINLAGQNAPDNKFVQRTAGEVLAWYDLRADKAKLPDQTKAGLDKIHSLLDNRPEYIAAYDTAKKAYQTSSSQSSQVITPYQPRTSTTPDAYVSPTPGDTNAQPPTAYYPAYAPDYYPYSYAYGPGWVAPAPWWWWQPAGFFVGFDFFPFHSVFVFHDHSFFSHHHGFFHDFDDFHHHGLAFHHDGLFFAHNHFFGTPARPNLAFAQLNHDHFVNGSGIRFSFNSGLGVSHFNNGLGVSHFNNGLGVSHFNSVPSGHSGLIRGFDPPMHAGGMPSRSFATPRFMGPPAGSLGAQHFAMHGGMGGFQGGMGGFQGGMGGFQGGMGGFHGGMGGFHGGMGGGHGGMGGGHGGGGGGHR